MSSETPPVEIKIDDKTRFLADLVLVVPADAPEYPTKVSGECQVGASESKLAFHTLSQIVQMDYEDGALAPEIVAQGTPILLGKTGGAFTSLDEGIIIVRDLENKIHVLSHDHVDTHRLIRFAHRYCTKQVRLDI